MDVDRLLVGMVIGAVLLGAPLGVGTSYAVWGTQASALAGDLEKTRAWLMDEIAQSDAHVKEALDTRTRELGAELQQLQTDLQNARAELRQSRAAEKAAADARQTERQRRRDLEARLAAQPRDCAGASPPGRRIPSARP